MIQVLFVLQETNDKQITDMNNHLDINETVVEQTRESGGTPRNPTASCHFGDSPADQGCVSTPIARIPSS